MLGDGAVSKGRGFHLDQRSARGHGVALRIGLLRITVGTSNVPRTARAPVGLTASALALGHSTGR